MFYEVTPHYPNQNADKYYTGLDGMMIHIKLNSQAKSRINISWHSKQLMKKAAKKGKKNQSGAKGERSCSLKWPSSKF